MISNKERGKLSGLAQDEAGNIISVNLRYRFQHFKKQTNAARERDRNLSIILPVMYCESIQKESLHGSESTTLYSKIFGKMFLSDTNRIPET